MEKEYIDYISRKELAELTGRDPKTIYRAMKDKRLRTEIVGKINKIPKVSAWEWWQEFYADKEDPKKNIEIKRALGIKDDNEDIVATRNKPSQNGLSAVSNMIPDDKVKQPKNTGVQVDKFLVELKKVGFDRDVHGIFYHSNDGKVYLSDFGELEFLYTKIIDGSRIRVVKIKDVEIELSSADLQNKGSFNKQVMNKCNYSIDMRPPEFQVFRNIIMKLDNCKMVEEKPGFGRITPDIFNLGNKMIINQKMHDFQSLVWLGKAGYSLTQTDQIRISEKPLALSNICSNFFQLYGDYAILILGFAVGTLFLQQYMKVKKHFPLLYLLGASGRGKSCMAELTCKLFGLDESLSIVNCAGNSTKIGTEVKSLLLNNLPIVFNELLEEQFSYIKSRYDGHGSYKYSDKHSNNLAERTVNGSSIITTVVEPHDKQIIRRSVFINLDDIKMKKAVFDQARLDSDHFSNFVIRILNSITFEQIRKQVEEFTGRIGLKYNPGITDNYAFIGGCFQTLRSIMVNDSFLPGDDRLEKFIVSQIRQTESYLNPLNHFIMEIERLADNPKAKKYIVQDDDYIYFHFKGIWDLISDSYKRKYFPFMNEKNLKVAIKESVYMAKYGRDLLVNPEHKAGKAATSHHKKIGNIPRRCFVLRKDQLPGSYMLYHNS